MTSELPSNHIQSVAHTQLPPRDEATLGPNPLPIAILNSSRRLAEWSQDKTAEEITRVVDHWSCTMFGINYSHLRTPYDRGRVFSKMSERLRAGDSIDGPDISIGNIFGSRAAESQKR